MTNVLIAELKSQDIGLTFRRSASSSAEHIQLDGNDEYTIASNFNLKTVMNVIIWDGAEKIAECNFTNQKLAIKIHTHKQVNIFADIIADECVIESSGPICCDNAITIKNFLKISAKALCFFGEIHSNTIDLQSQYGIGLLGPIQANQLQIHAAFVHQSSTLNLTGQYDLTAQAIQHEHTAKTKVHVLRMIGDQINLSGELVVNGLCFIASYYLSFGQSERQSTISLQGKSHLHLYECIITGDTQVALSGLDNQWIVDNSLSISNGAILDLKQTSYSIAHLVNEGEFTLKQAKGNMNDFQQKGTFIAYQSTIYIHLRLHQTIDKNSNLKKSNLHCEQISIDGGVFDLKSTQIIAQECAVFAGKIILSQSSVDLSQWLMIYDSAIAEISASQVNVKQAMHLNGVVKILDSTLVSDSIQTHHHMIDLKDARITTQKSIIFSCGALIKNSTLKSAEVALAGKLDIDTLLIEAHSLAFKSKQSEIKSCTASARCLTLDGGDVVGSVQFSSSTLTADVISQSQHITLNDSYLIGICVDKTSHDINGSLVLNNSQLITESQVHNTAESQFKLKNDSRLYAGMIFNNGNLQLENAATHSQEFYNSNAQLSASNSKIYVCDQVISNNAQVEIQKNSQMLADEVYHSGTLKLKGNSILASRTRISISQDAEMLSEESTIATVKFITLGRVELRNTILSADEICIYEQFDALDKSYLKVKDNVLCGEDSAVKLVDSTIMVENLDVAAQIQIKNSILCATQQVHVWKDASMQLESAAAMSSQNLLVRGVIESQSTTHSTPQINVKDRFTLCETSKIAGNNLQVEAATLSNGGSIDISQHLLMRGRNLVNCGVIKANELFMGYDEVAMNLGSISGDSVTMHGNFINLFGQVSARKNFASSGFFNLNLGFVHANNYVSDSMVSLHGGLVLPDFSADREYLFSTSNLCALAKIGLTTIAPAHATSINTAFMIPGIFNSAKTLYQMSLKYDWNAMQSMRTHEMMPIFCQAKSSALLPYHAYRSYHVREAGTTEHTNWRQTGKRFAGIFAGSYSDNSILHMNFGTGYMPTTTKSNYFHFNGGHEHSLLSQSINTHYLYNVGSTGADESTYTAKSIYNSGSIYGDHLTVSAKNLQNSEEGMIVGNHCAVHLDTVKQQGTLKLKNGHATIDTFCDEKSATTHLDDMHVNSHSWSVSGSLLYRHAVQLTAETTKFENGSKVTGDKNAKDQPPIHSLKIATKELTLAGQLSGGDYSQIQGDKVIVDKSAEIDLENGSIIAKSSEISGKATLKNFNIQIQDTTLNQQGELSLDKGHYQGVTLKSDGHLNLDTQKISVDQIQLSKQASETIKDTSIHAIKIEDLSHLSYQGEVFTHCKEYNHRGRLTVLFPNNQTASENLFYVKAELGELKGSGSLGKACFDIDHFQDVSQFVAGAGDYNQYQFSDRLNFTTLDRFRSTHSLERNCDLSVTASAVNMLHDYAKQFSLSLTSTVENISLAANMRAKNLIAHSAKHFYTNKKLSTEELLQFEADGEFNNLGGTLDGDIVAVKASSIKNITAGSAVAKKTKQLSIGQTGKIKGRNKTFLESTQTNIENHGGIIDGGDYTQLISAGNVLNVCNETVLKGRYDRMVHFTPGVIAGGHGNVTNKLGLLIKANGKVILDSSSLHSKGDNYIEGVKGIDCLSRHHTYISKDEIDERFLGFSEWHSVSTSTKIQNSSIHSDYGRSVLRSVDGKVKTIGTLFTSPGGTDIFSKGKVELFSLKSQDKSYEYSSHLWGLNNHERHSICQSSTPTLFHDHGLTRIHSETGCIDARGAYFSGSGDLWLKAKKKILFSADILNHQVHENNLSLNISIPGITSLDDPTFNKMRDLSGSRNIPEAVANSVNLGINLYNSTKSFMRGFANQSLDKEVLARYGLGSVNLSIAKGSSHHHYQTRGMGGVNRGGHAYFAAEELVLQNGVRVHVDGRMEVDAEKVCIQGVPLKSKHSFENTSIHLGVNPLAHSANVGFAYSNSDNQSSEFLNSELSANHLMMHNKQGAIKNVKLVSGNIQCKIFDAKFDRLLIVDQQDEIITDQESFGASTSGQFSFYSGDGHEKVTKKKSGIFVESGLNSNGHTFTVNQLQMKGGEIKTDGLDQFNANEVDRFELKDRYEYSGFGISANVNDLARVAGIQKATNAPGENAIATATVMIDRDDVRLKMDVPITNYDYQQQASTNIRTTPANDVEVVTPVTTQAIEQQSSIVNELIHDEAEYLTEHSETLSLPEKFATSQPGTSELPDVIMQSAVTDTINNNKAQKEKYLDAMLVTVKTGKKVSYKQIMKVMGEEFEDHSVKLIVNPTTRLNGLMKTRMMCVPVLFSFSMNLAIYRNSDKQEMVKDATAGLIGDFSFGFLLAKTFGKGATPVGLAWTAANLIDSFTYDEQRLDKVLAQVKNQRLEAHQKYQAGGSLIAYYVDNSIATELENSALAEKVLHQIIIIPGHIKSGLKWIYNSTFPSMPKKDVGILLKKQGVFKPARQQMAAEPEQSQRLGHV